MQVTEELELNNLRDRRWHIQGCSAKTGDGLQVRHIFSTFVPLLVQESILFGWWDKLCVLLKCLFFYGECCD
jgi:hypothetical protein